MLRMTPVALALSVFMLPQSAGAQTTAASSEATLAPVKVKAGPDSPADTPPPYAGKQVARGARLGALGNQDLMDTPFNITAYTAELIENQHARSIADVVANDPSVRFTTSNGHMYENFRIRGFDVNQNDVSIDGLFGLVPSGHVPLEFIERVEVFKGPSALFGGMAPSGAVGGTINLSPKRAGDAPLTRVSVGFQSGSQFGTHLDAGRRFGDDKAWGLRVNAAYSDGDTTLDGQSKKREFISAALDYRGKPLKASLDTYYSKESFKGGTPAMFWFTTPDIPKAPDPSINQFPAAYGELESKAVIARANYEFHRGLSAFAGIGLMRHDFAGFINGTHVRSINATGTSKTSFTSGQRGYNENLASEAGLRANFDTAGVGHELVLHASSLEQESGSGSSISSPVFTTSIYNPTFQAMPALPVATPRTSETDLSSVALIDTLSLADDRVRLTVGLRNQQIKTTNYNAAGKVTAQYDKSAVTPAVAIIVKPWGPAVSLYANYVEGLSKGDTVTTPTTATNYLHVFAPYKTEQKEAGVKWNAGSFAHTASLFEITRPMMIALGSSTAPTLSDDGEKRVRGLEWNTFGEVARGLRLLGGATFTQGVQTKTAYGLNDGKTAVGAPRWQGNLGTEWDVPGIPGLTVSGRLIATTNQYLDAANTLRIPGWGQVDAGARYATVMDGRKLVLRLNVINLFDRHYYAGSFSDTTPIATLGLARSVSASATMDF